MDHGVYFLINVDPATHFREENVFLLFYRKISLDYLCMMRPRGKTEVRTQTLSLKSQEAIGFLRNTDTDPLKKQLDPLGPILLFEGGSYGHL